MKTPLFITIKHLIEGVNKENASRIERYVNNYCKVEGANSVDKLELKNMFNQKIKGL